MRAPGAGWAEGQVRGAGSVASSECGRVLTRDRGSLEVAPSPPFSQAQGMGQLNLESLFAVATAAFACRGGGQRSRETSKVNLTSGCDELCSSRPSSFPFTSGESSWRTEASQQEFVQLV